MTNGLKHKNPSGRAVYPDIIDHPHWQSPTRPHMSLYDRAAQFASFDALAGYSDMISEEQRLTDQKIELEERPLELLNRQLGRIAEAIAGGAHPTVTITYFVPDQKKAGGTYRTAAEQIKKIDEIKGALVLMRTEGVSEMNAEIRIEDIMEIRDGNSGY